MTAAHFRPDLHVRRSKGSIGPLTDVSTNKMLRSARMTAVTGRDAAIGIVAGCRLWADLEALPQHRQLRSDLNLASVLGNPHEEVGGSKFP